MSFSNMKIAARLGLGFGLVLLLLVGLLAVSVRNQVHVAEVVDHLAVVEVRQLELANEMLTNTLSNAILTQRLLATTDAGEMTRIQQDMAAGSKKNSDALAEYEKLATTDEEKAKLTAWKDARAPYMAARAKALDLVLKSSKRDEATRLWESEVAGKFAAYTKVATELGEFQKRKIDKSNAASDALMADSRNLLLGLGALALVVGIGFAWWITRSITRPLREAVEVAEVVANGDLTRTIEARSTDETGQLLAALSRMNGQLGSVISTIRESTDAVGTASREIAQGNADLSQRTEEQASSLEETASSMEELTSTVKQNADNARQANQLAASASEVAVKGGAVVGEVVSTMGAISASSKKIADIISVIDGIAFQTNILALNAAVEAARAGEQGRGFAVVASEVRSLAQRSAGAAKEIKELITDSVTKVDSGTKLVADAGNTMAEVVASVKRVTDIMAEITAASLEQSSGIEQVNQAIVQMDQVTQQNAALVEESAAAAESMEEQAKVLSSAVAVFKVAGGNVATPAKAVIERAQAAAKAATRRAQPANVKAMPPPRGRGTPAKLPSKPSTDDEWAEF